VTQVGRFLALTLLYAALVACGPPEQPQKSATSPQKADLRIVTLSPHLAELVFAVGAGDLVVGVSAYTDYPDAAAQLPIVGDAFNLDQEQLAVLEPDLLLAWETGTPAHVIDQLRNRGYRVEIISTIGVHDVSAALKHVGQLTGYVETATVVAAEYEYALEQLAAERRNAEPVRVFYQVDARPLYTINGDHYLSQLIEICGGVNIFSDLGGLAPLISVESVLERDPEIMLASTDAGPQAFDEWQRWSDMAAIRYGNEFLMPANEIGRATPRLLVGAKAVCDALEKGRDNRDKSINE